MSLKEAIFASSDLLTKVISVPEWGGVKLLLRTTTAEDRIRVALLANERPNAMYDALLLVCVLRGEDGELVFDGTVDDVNRLSRKSHAVIARIARELGDLNGTTVASVEAEKKD